MPKNINFTLGGLNLKVRVFTPHAVYTESRLCSLRPSGRFQPNSLIASASWWECLGPDLESCFGFSLPRAVAQGIFLPLHVMAYEHKQCCLNGCGSGHGSWRGRKRFCGSPRKAWTCQTSLTPKPVQALSPGRGGGKRDPWQPGSRQLALEP